MEGELVRCRTPDNIELEGIFANVNYRDNNPTVLHLHGMFENFYLPLFIDPLSAKITSTKSPFLTVNTRAHDYIIYCRRWNNREYTWDQQGGSHELFSNCLQDINGWIDFLEKRGIDDLILSGHSHGALKAAYYNLNTNKDCIKGLCLISPSDDIGLQKRALEGEYNKALDIAEEMNDEGRGDEFMPSWVYDNPVTAKMYLDMFSSESELDMFRFDEPSSGFKRFNDIRIPVLTIFAENDKATSSKSSEIAIELINEKMANCPSFQGKVIENTEHHYYQKENELAETVSSWITEEFKNI